MWAVGAALNNTAPTNGPGLIFSPSLNFLLKTELVKGNI